MHSPKWESWTESSWVWRMWSRPFWVWNNSKTWAVMIHPKQSHTCSGTQAVHPHIGSHIISFSLPLSTFVCLFLSHTHTRTHASAQITIPTQLCSPRLYSQLRANRKPSGCCRYPQLLMVRREKGRGVELECQGQRKVCAGGGMRWMGGTMWAEPGGLAPVRQPGAAALTPAGRWWHKSWSSPLGSSDSATGLNEIYRQMRPTCEIDTQVTQTNETYKWNRQVRWSVTQLPSFWV